MHRKFLPQLLLALITLLLTSPIPLHAWELAGTRLVPETIAVGIKHIHPRVEADLDGNTTPETLKLTEGVLDILSAGKTAWQSPKEWNVVQAEFADLNRDGAFEVTLLVWRPFRSWPVDKWLPNGGRIASFHDADRYSCQIILIGWRNGQYREMWAGSALAEPIKSFAAADINGDGVQEMVTLENGYEDPRSATGETLKVWEWNGFGFTVVSKIVGAFSKMALVRASDGRILILIP
jgi:hypothetical protein